MSFNIHNDLMRFKLSIISSNFRDKKRLEVIIYPRSQFY